eukprot:jgi/Undpi1/7829/HiC_scaffold_23.g10302.m1
MDEDDFSNDEESSGDSDSENDADDDGWDYMIDTYAVNDSAEDTVTSSLQRPSALRKLGEALDMSDVAAAETALRMGKDVLGGKDNVLVLPHGKILSGFHNDDAFSQRRRLGCRFREFVSRRLCGPEDPSSKRPVSFKRRARVSLNRRDDGSGKNRYFLFCVAAITIRQRALSNVQFNLRGRVSDSTARRLYRKHRNMSW